MDAVLRARHDALTDEFVCAATELTIVRTPPGSLFSRTIDAFCSDERAPRFGGLLTDYGTCCAGCLFLNPRPEELEDSDAAEDLALETS
ncbi:MAG TPA: hypothetical protein VK821_16705 [Dehalococcoidia bacterium]|nr:hypothetical protein [Dehalococcoidia bacterium]